MSMCRNENNWNNCLASLGHSDIKGHYSRIEGLWQYLSLSFEGWINGDATDVKCFKPLTVSLPDPWGWARWWGGHCDDSGGGGDELLAGTPFWHPELLARPPPPVPESVPAGRLNQGPRGEKKKGSSALACLRSSIGGGVCSYIRERTNATGAFPKRNALMEQ